MPDKIAPGVSTDTPEETLPPPGAVDWDDYRFFLTVARTGNFRRAAQELTTTQATVSRRIENLERVLETKLFDRPRGRGGVVLTFDGRRVLQEVSAAELSLGRTKRRRPGGRETAGDCKILGTDGIANFWIPPFLRAFTLKYPNIQWRYFITTDPAQNQRPPFDLQLQYLAAGEADAVSHQLATLHMTFFASQEYIAMHGRPKDLDALKHHRLLKFASLLSDEQSWPKYRAEVSSQHGVLYSNSSAFIAETVLAGGGIGLLPTYICAANQRFVPLLSDFHLEMGVFLNFHPDAAKKPAVRTTIDFLKNVAFDRRAMPWFREIYEAPAADWPALYRARVADASPVVAAMRAG